MGIMKNIILCLKNRKANLVIMTVFLTANLTLAGMSVDFLNTREVISILYALNMKFAIEAVGFQKSQSKHCDEECHPKKLVTDFFGVYVHRRGLFYRNRKVCAVGKRQFTRSFLLRGGSQSFKAFEYSLLNGKKDEKRMEDTTLHSGSSSGLRRKRSSLKGPKEFFRTVKKSLAKATKILKSENALNLKKKMESEDETDDEDESEEENAALHGKNLYDSKMESEDETDEEDESEEKNAAFHGKNLYDSKRENEIDEKDSKISFDEEIDHVPLYNNKTEDEGNR
ncbi:uncharacterized protein CEXT_768851 [Caerostris extrusa]|uniref:Uncharacterized protein n=1 Tax=Caerostris extrusa TaxID=172846 RepID=A0AAV4V4Z2_CAEEX|nr:uncharacterized protein CEXT_768851 [Caerostris extrusa]